MKIKYLGKQILVKWRGTDKETLFAPYAEVPDEFGKRLLANPELMGQFEEVQSKEYVCPDCNVRYFNAPALNLHKLRHKKEKQGENNTNVARRGRPPGKSKLKPDQSGVVVESGGDINRPDIPEGQLRDGHC